MGYPYPNGALFIKVCSRKGRVKTGVLIRVYWRFLRACIKVS